MRVVNSDGSESEMCGNGLRCVAVYLSETIGGQTFRIWTKVGIMLAQVSYALPFSPLTDVATVEP